MSIARAVEDRLGDQADLLDDRLSPEAAVWVDRILQVIGRSKSSRPAQADKVDGVLVDGIATENVVQLGPQMVARAAWRELGLDRILGQAGLNAAQIATAQLLVASFHHHGAKPYAALRLLKSPPPQINEPDNRPGSIRRSRRCPQPVEDILCRDRFQCFRVSVRERKERCRRAADSNGIYPRGMRETEKPSL